MHQNLGFRKPLFTVRERMDDLSQITSQSFANRNASVALYRRDQPAYGLSSANPPMDSYMAVMHLRPFPGHQEWCDGRIFDIKGMETGSARIFDLRQSWMADLPDPFHTVNFFIPQAALHELCYELGAPGIEELRLPPHAIYRDAVMMNLASAVLPALQNPSDSNGFFIDHIFAAFSYHIAVTYGGLHFTGKKHVGLAPWQEKRAKDFMLERLDSELSLVEVAEVCGLSSNYFARAFKQSTGLPPYRWLLHQRVERAKDFLTHTSDTLSDIALACGFADQSHFTRVFSRIAGINPGSWRKIWKN